MEYLASWYKGALDEAAANCQPGDRLIVDEPCKLSATLTFPNSYVTVILRQPIDATAVGVAFLLTGSFITIQAEGNGLIYGSQQSSVMVEKGSDGCVIDGLQITNYNTSDTNGHAAIFGHQCSNLTVRNCRISSGNGNGIRAGSVVGCTISGNVISHTFGQSSEGITIGSDADVIGNKVSYANVTGILACGGPYQRIRVSGNTISNCSQSMKAGHPAVALNLQNNDWTGIEVSGNFAYDDQQSPTQACLLMVYGPGSIASGGVYGNAQWGCCWPRQVTVADGVPPSLTDWVVA